MQVLNKEILNDLMVSDLGLRNHRFLVRAHLPAMCRGELSVAITRLILSVSEAGGSGRKDIKR